MPGFQPKPRVSIRILHYTKDEARKRYLAEVLEAFGGIEKAKEECFSFEIFEDNEGHNRNFWDICRLAWWDIPEGATHHMVMSDDMRPCPDFLKALPLIIAARPTEPIGFFSMRMFPDRVKENGQWWWKSMTNMWGGSFMIPVPILKDMLPWIDANIVPEYKHDDVRIKGYNIEHGIWTWQTGPSLFEHIGAADSTLGNSNRLRVARWLWERSALEIPWHEIPADRDIVADSGHGTHDKDRKDLFLPDNPWWLSKREREEKYGRRVLRPEDFVGLEPWRY